MKKYKKHFGRRSLVSIFCFAIFFVSLPTYSQSSCPIIDTLHNSWDSARDACHASCGSVCEDRHLGVICDEGYGACLSNGQSGRWKNYYVNTNCEIALDGKCIQKEEANELGNPSQCSTHSPPKSLGNPINILTGNKFQSELDYFEISSGLALSRSYNSQLPILGDFGNSWQSNFHMSINIDASEEHVIAKLKDGALETFSKSGTEWLSDQHSSSTLIHEQDLSWTLIDNSSSTYTYNASGKLTSLKTIDGVELRATYTNDLLETITDEKGGSIQFVYNSNRIIESVVTPGGIFEYQYDENKNLVEVIFPDSTPEQNQDNHRKQYHYENNSYPNALTGITDENGVRFATWEYDMNGRAIVSEHFGSERVELDYTFVDDQVDPRIIATNSLGKESVYHIEMVNGAREITAIEGVQSANCVAANKNYTYYPNGLLESKTDWQGNTTSYRYNDRNLESSRIEAVGTNEARIITTDWHPSFNLRTKITEPGKETVFTYDDQGRRLEMIVNSFQAQELGSDFNRIDSDGDGLADLWEQFYFGSLQFIGDDDFDNDGLSNLIEYLIEMYALDSAADTDGDSLLDDWELQFFGSLSQLGTEDSDDDGVSNYVEMVQGTNPADNPNSSYTIFETEGNATVSEDQFEVTTYNDALDVIRVANALCHKTYVELELKHYSMIGVSSENSPSNWNTGGANSAYVYMANGGLYGSAGGVGGNTGLLNGIAGMAIDPSSKKFWLRKIDGSWLNGDPVSGTGGVSFTAMSGSSVYLAINNGGAGSGTNTVRVNLGQESFVHTEPTGYFGIFNNGEFVSCGSNSTLPPPSAELYETSGNATVSVDQTQITTYDNANDAARTIEAITAKTYFELELNTNTMVGVANDNSLYSWHNAPANAAYLYLANGGLYASATGTGGNTGLLGGVAGFAVDPVAKKFWLRKIDGTWLNGDPITGSGGVSFSTMTGSTVHFAVNNGGGGTGTVTVTVNMGQEPFIHAVPVGFNE